MFSCMDPEVLVNSRGSFISGSNNALTVCILFCCKYPKLTNPKFQSKFLLHEICCDSCDDESASFPRYFSAQLNESGERSTKVITQLFDILIKFTGARSSRPLVEDSVAQLRHLSGST